MSNSFIDLRTQQAHNQGLLTGGVRSDGLWRASRENQKPSWGLRGPRLTVQDSHVSSRLPCYFVPSLSRKKICLQTLSTVADRGWEAA